MRAVAAAELVGMALSFFSALWIAMQTTMVTLTAISVVFFALSAFLHHRMRREPANAGGHDLLSSLEHDMAREDWNLAQLRVGRVITVLTLFAIGIMTADHLRHLATTPPERVWALVAVALVVVLLLVTNIWLARQAKARRSRMQAYSEQLRGNGR
jgi:hypothetical protein